MIKFFRKIRQKSLIENKFTKYLIYALGEIVLVVIGIVIALQINNQNEESKLKHKELILLIEMQLNLKEDLSVLNGTIGANKERIRSNEAVKTALETKLPFNDSLKYHFGNTFGNFQLTENTSAWENMKSIGFDLISNDSLRNSLSRLYSTKYVYLENVEKGVDDWYQWKQLYPQVLKHIHIEMLWVSGTPENYEELIEDREFLEVIKLNIFLRNFMQNKYIDVQKEVSLVLIQLDKHLQYLND
ncbi:hypothetical protein ERX46_05980 [Brumimicrobium glaciale]|uniref:Uncharacterized protein n=1 Tax=Brumimicrobium glaciale TaxID=200475 RepID=A0A4Q4KNH6_9FLAO|nr:DUF6090 family protein [Brumimicrobium glaciale]RYM34922.1 hypothetical protein ERX46_05980 [Brumimicrobium glaciale]